MKKILVVISLLFLCTLTTSNVSAMSLRVHAHRNHSHFRAPQHIISNKKNNHKVQENSTSTQHIEQDTTSQLQLGVVDAILRTALCVAGAAWLLGLLIDILR